MGLDLVVPPFSHSSGCLNRVRRIRANSQALLEVTQIEGARIFDAEPVNNASFLRLSKNWPAGFLQGGKM